MRHLVRWSLLLVCAWAALAGPAGAQSSDCTPAPMQGSDWGAAVAAREAACAGASVRDLRPSVRALTPVPVSIYDPRVRFAFDSAELLPDATPTLDRLAAFLMGGEGTRRFVRVEGHTDATGGAGYNLALSQRRADAVRFYLIGHGVPAQRLRSMGFGLTQPLPGLDPHAAENRRVQFRIGSDAS